MNELKLKRFNQLMRTLERLTGLSMLVEEFEQKYMDLKDYDRSLTRLINELSGQIDQLEMEGIK